MLAPISISELCTSLTSSSDPHFQEPYNRALLTMSSQTTWIPTKTPQATIEEHSVSSTIINANLALEIHSYLQAFRSIQHAFNSPRSISTEIDTVHQYCMTLADLCSPIIYSSLTGKDVFKPRTPQEIQWLRNETKAARKLLGIREFSMIECSELATALISGVMRETLRVIEAPESGQVWWDLRGQTWSLRKMMWDANYAAQRRREELKSVLAE